MQVLRRSHKAVLLRLVLKGSRIFQILKVLNEPPKQIVGEINKESEIYTLMPKEAFICSSRLS